MRLGDSVRLVMLRATALVVTLGVIGPNAYATSNEYDGTWRLDGSCSADSIRNLPRFEYHWTTTIENGAYSRTITTQHPDGSKSEDRWSATIQGRNIAINVDGSDDHGHRWLRRYSGNAISATEINISGDFLVPSASGGWQKNRTCTGALTQIAPSPSSSAAKE
jgi:hypothetical protein